MRTRKVVLSTSSEKETFNVGVAVGSLLKANTIIALGGELGVGKTLFIKGAAKSLGVDCILRSPTFTLLQEYIGAIPIYHFDFYRLEEEEELWEIGFHEYLENGGIVFIEWAFKFPSSLPDERLDIFIETYNLRDSFLHNRRKLYLVPYGEYYENLVDKLLEINQYDSQGKLMHQEIAEKDKGGAGNC